MGTTIIFTRPFCRRRSVDADAFLFTHLQNLLSVVETLEIANNEKLFTRTLLLIKATNTMAKFPGGNTETIEAYRTLRVYVIPHSLPILITRKLSMT